MICRKSISCPCGATSPEGIFASVHEMARYNIEADIIVFYKEYYRSSPFVFVSDEPISLKEVVNTNKGLLHVEFHNGYIHITSITDNSGERGIGTGGTEHEPNVRA